jgi:hypothetical protein
VVVVVVELEVVGVAGSTTTEAGCGCTSVQEKHPLVAMHAPRLITTINI